MDWQTLISLLIVTCAAMFIGVRCRRFFRNSAAGGCSGCSGTACQATSTGLSVTPLVQLGSPPVAGVAERSATGKPGKTRIPADGRC